MTFASIGNSQLRYHRWATTQVLDESAPLSAELLVKDFGDSFAGIYGTLKHLYQADAVWLDRLRGRPTGSSLDVYEAPGCTYELRDAWLAVQDEMLSVTEALSEDGWAREISYKTLNGTPFVTPVWQMILHIVNHGSHHRGQITTMLRQLKIKPVGLDLIAFYRANQLTATAV